MDNRCRIYQDNRNSIGISNKRTYNTATNGILLALTSEQVKYIEFDRGVLDLRNMAIRRAGIDDKKPLRIRARIYVSTDDESLCGEYLLERENEDVYYLTRVE